MPIPNDYNALIRRLVAVTAEGKLSWQPLPDNGVHFKDGALSITLYAGYDEEADEEFVSFQLREQRPPASGELPDAQVDHWYVAKGDPDYVVMLNLHGSASR